MILFRPLLRASTAARRNQLYCWRYQTHRLALTRRCYPPVGRLAGRWVRAIFREVTELTATVTQSVLARPLSIPPPITLQPRWSSLLALAGLFLLK
jgi:hypothetical protein